MNTLNMIHTFEIEGLAIQTGDIICTSNGKPDILPGEFWRLDDLDLLRVFGDGSEMDLVPAEGHASSECLAGVSCTEDGNAHDGSMTYGCRNLDVGSAVAECGKGLDKASNTARE